MFWLRNKKNNFLVHTLIWRPYIAFHKKGMVKFVRLSVGNMRTTCVQKIIDVDDGCVQII